MKTIIYELLLTNALFFTSLCVQANNPVKKDSIQSTQCLEVVGMAIDEKNKAIDGAEIKLYKENEELEWQEVTSVNYHDHNFVFKLEANSFYTIEISKPGFVKRSVSISTVIPDNTKLKTVLEYGFDVTLIEEKKEMDDYYLDFPVALVSYNSKTGSFENHNAYTKHIKGKIKEEEEQAEIKRLLRTNN
ncbi:MAG: hypothetical protein ACXVPU_13740 [Bacteroidia bacterium]